MIYTAIIFLIYLIILNLIQLSRMNYALNLINKAINVEEGRASDINNYEWLPLSTESAQKYLVEAVDILNQIKATDFISLRKKALAMALLGQYEDSIAILSEATEIQPESPLVWFELGAAYYYLDKLSSLSSTVEILVPKQDRIISKRWSLPLGKTVYSDWWSPIYFPSFPAYDKQNVVLSVHVPEAPSLLVIWSAAIEQSTQARFAYQVSINDQSTIEQEVGTSEMSKWNTIVIDLSNRAKQDITVKLTANVVDAKFAWGPMAVVAKKALPCYILNCRLRAIAAWQTGGFTTDQFLAALETAEMNQHYKAAQSWKARISYITRESIDRFSSDYSSQELVIIESFTTASGINICPWCSLDLTKASFTVDKGLLLLNNGTSVYMSELNYDINHFKNLIVRLRGTEGNALAIIEIYIDDQEFQRHFIEVTEDWIDWKIPITGSNLYMIIIGTHNTQSQVNLEVDWIGAE